MSALLAVTAALMGAGSAQAGFVPALGSPFPYAAPIQALAVVDADRNGTVDVVAGGLTLRRGAGSGFLGIPLTVGSPGPVEGLAPGDLNGDTLPDYAAIAPGMPRRLLQYTANGGGGYAETTLMSDAGDATDVAVANVNGDGLPDVVLVADDPNPNVTVVLGGTLTEVSYNSDIDSPADVEVGDMTGDGLPDIVVAGDEPRVSVLANAGGGIFLPGATTPTGAGGATTRIALTDFDFDGRLDVLASDSAAASLLALHGDGDGTLTLVEAAATGLPGATTAVAGGDFDGDGRADAVAGGPGGAFAVLLGNGGGGFGPVAGSPFPTGDPSSIVDDLSATDMNRDGQTDVVAANRGGSVAVQLNDATGLLTPQPARVDFGRMLPLSGPRARTLTLRATRGRLRITRLDLQGARSFRAADGNCVGRTLLLGQSCSLTVTYTPPRKAGVANALLSVDANAAAVVVPLTATPRPPVVVRPRLKAKRVVRGKRLDLRYRLSEAARVRILLQQALPGRRVAGECVAPRRGNLTRRPCTLWQTVTTLDRRRLAGINRQRIATRIKRRALPVGAYRLSVSAVDRFRNRSEEKLVRFALQAARAPK